MNDKPRLLIVDDEPTARDTLEALLYNENYELRFAASGREALDQLDELDPDVILLDVMMPHLDGFEVAQRLKKSDKWQHIPIILITALNNKEDIVKGLDAGADEFISKPVSGLELRARVRSMLRIKRHYDELLRTVALREDMASMIVHDMRGPLNTILCFSELLLSNSSIAYEHLQDIERIFKQGHRLRAFANDILMMAKMEQGQFVINRSLVDLNQLVLEVEKDHHVIARSKKINLVVDLPVNKAKLISCDPNLFQRVLDNLLSNALKFSQRGDTVMVRVEYPEPSHTLPYVEPMTRLHVIDQGPGIACEDRERIFNKFEVISSQQNHVSQIGLGLAFCKLVVEAHKGHIWVEDNQPHGSIFTVEV